MTSTPCSTEEGTLKDPEQPVTIDHGDLLELLQAAAAWAGYQRRRGSIETADRIDKAIHQSREFSTPAIKR
jgi:hypothetical protein